MARCKHVNNLGHQCNQNVVTVCSDYGYVGRVFTKGIHMTTGYSANMERTDHESGLCAFHLRMQKATKASGGLMK